MDQYNYEIPSFLSLDDGKVKIKEESKFSSFVPSILCLSMYPYLQVVRRILEAKLSVLDISGGGGVPGGILKILNKKLNIIFPQNRRMTTY